MKILPKWQNFAQSGHTDCHPLVERSKFLGLTKKIIFILPCFVLWEIEHWSTLHFELVRVVCLNNCFKKLFVFCETTINVPSELCLGIIKNLRFSLNLIHDRYEALNLLDKTHHMCLKGCLPSFENRKCTFLVKANHGTWCVFSFQSRIITLLRYLLIRLIPSWKYFISSRLNCFTAQSIPILSWFSRHSST